MKRILGCLLVAAGLVLAFGAQAADDSRVWVVFKAAQKASVKAQIQAAQGRIHYEFDDLRAIAVTLPSAALSGMRANPGVEYVEEDPPRYMFAQTQPYGVGLVQAPQAWTAGAVGTGIKVGVIDSGVHSAHEDFNGVALSGQDDSGTGPWNTDRCGHGTHVVGTIAAASNDLGVVGVSPGKVSVYIVKVFGDNCAWTYSSTLVNAAQTAIGAGAKIISMSLGGSLKSRTEESAFNQFYASGVLSVAAAGNSGTTQNSYPASYSSVVSVAAVDQNKVVADFSQKNSQVELAAPGVGVLSTVPFLPSSVAVGSTTYPGENIDGSARANATGQLVSGGLCSSSGNWSGKVVLCQRGVDTFATKVANVKTGGGVAAVIYNNVSGGFTGTLNGTSTIPAISVSKEDGEKLLLTVGSPATVTNLIAEGSGYAYYDGTSMATPHVSAVAALVWSAYPCATNSQVRSALQASAEDLGPAGRDTSYGYGLVRAKAALDALAGLGLNCGGGGGDTTAPVITKVQARITNAKNGSFEITWTTNEPATSDVELVGFGWYADSNLTTEHKRTFRGTKGATYTYYVRSKDAAGNPAVSGPHTHQN